MSIKFLLATPMVLVFDYKGYEVSIFKRGRMLIKNVSEEADALTHLQGNRRNNSKLNEMQATQASANPQRQLTGRAVFLISGGIDSPVAASMLIRKGVEPVFAYFDSYPLCDQAAEGIAFETVRRVCTFHQVTGVKFYSVQHSADLEEIVTKCPEKYACILSRRLMFRIAEKIGVHENCDAIVTGDAIGQKASQTLQNITATDCVMERLPVVRPLVGMNKLDIERHAKNIKTYEISIKPGVATCGVPTRNPSTSARKIRLEEVEAHLDLSSMVENAFKNAAHSSTLIFNSTFADQRQHPDGRCLRSCLGARIPHDHASVTPQCDLLSTHTPHDHEVRCPNSNHKII